MNRETETTNMKQMEILEPKVTITEVKKSLVADWRQQKDRPIKIIQSEEQEKKFEDK